MTTLEERTHMLAYIDAKRDRYTIKRNYPFKLKFGRSVATDKKAYDNAYEATLKELSKS